jgi:hypothetical protein
LLDLPIQAGRLAWQHRLRRADRRSQPPASGSGFPVPSASPGFPWEVSVSDVKVFLLLRLARRKRPRGATEIFFVIHRMTVVIHA